VHETKIKTKFWNSPRTVHCRINYGTIVGQGSARCYKSVD